MRAPERSLRSQLWLLAERRRYLAGLEALAASLHSDAQRLRDEADHAGDAGEREAAQAGRWIVERSIAEVEIRLTAARSAVAETMQTVKRHELSGRKRTRQARPRRPQRR